MDIGSVLFKKMVLLSKNLLEILDSSKMSIAVADIGLGEHDKRSKIEASDRKWLIDDSVPDLWTVIGVF